jgi:indole-3-glycerol phosphate synthase
MGDILRQIAKKTRERIEKRKREMPLSEIRAMAEEKTRCVTDYSPEQGGIFRRALAAPGMSFICECKKASPSKGLIAPDFPYIQIARDYEAGGASAISCLTEPFWFLGKDEYVREIARTVSIPVLRKDFTVDEYMIYEAREMGASAILLICAILDDEQLRDFRALARELHLDVLTEAHDESEIDRAVRSGADIIGVNNRNLRDFTVDVRNSEKLRRRVPRDILFVSESGIRTPDDIRLLEEMGTDAVLIGETLMRADDRVSALRALRGVR